jgi:hypothetical protein
MTTDPMSEADRAARLEALRQRRSQPRQAVPPDTTRPTPVPAPNASPRRRTGRRHAAAGGRILAGSLSAAAALGLIGVMTDAVTPATAPETPVAAVTPAAPTVIVVHRTPSASGVAQPAPAPPVVATAAPPVTASRGS